MKFIFNIFLLSSISLLFGCASSEEPSRQASTTTDYYNEVHRPQFHFSPAANWMNDPNGMVYYDGEYHLFYQYYPDSTVWGPMHWGHAVSTDLVHWEHLPIALYPDSLGYIFSGSAVIDWENTSGLGENDQPPMIAIFTHHDMEGEKAGTNTFQYQSIAYSNDKGRTWIMYAGNPVVPNPGIKDFRDPKVIWLQDSKKWVMIFAAYDKAMIYTSPDLKDWTFASEFGIPGDTRLWECPDLFPLTVAETGETRWVLIVSIQQRGPNGGTATGYFIGDFDGKTFKGDNTQQYWADYGRDNYAMVTWSDIPAEDGRRLGIGWMSNWQYAQVVPTQEWRSAMTLPRELKLKNTDAGLRMISLPVVELHSIRNAAYPIKSQTIDDPLNLTQTLDLSGALFEMEFDVVVKGDTRFSIILSNAAGEEYHIGYDGETNTFFSDRTQSGDASFSKEFAKAAHIAPRISEDETVSLHLFFDRSSAELFADGGEVAMTDIYFPSEVFTNIQLKADGPVEITKGTVYSLSSIW